MFVEDKLSLLPAGVVERRRDKGLIKNDLRRMALTLHGFCQANFRLPLDIKPGKFLKIMHCTNFVLSYCEILHCSTLMCQFIHLPVKIRVERLCYGIGLNLWEVGL